MVGGVCTEKSGGVECIVGEVVEGWAGCVVRGSRCEVGRVWGGMRHAYGRIGGGGVVVRLLEMEKYEK